MTSRREFLIGAAAAAAALASDPAASLMAAAPPFTKVDFSVPAGAWDTHTHVIGDPKQFPFWSGRVYTPEPAPADESLALHKKMHIARIMVVQPSFYGPDMSCTLDALKRFGPSSRGVAVTDDKTTDAQLDAMHRGGIRAVRLNFQTFNETDPGVTLRQFQTAVKQTSGRNWHIQMLTTLPVLEHLKQQIMESPVPVSVDHFCYAKASLGTSQPGFATLVQLVQSGKLYVKLSGAYRISSADDYSDVTPIAKALIAANPQRILWGSDWPHPGGAPLPGHTATDIAPNLPIDDGKQFNMLKVWAPDAGLRKTILVDNPDRLFGS